ncbi:MAG: HAD family hydrolase [Deltaproteobacteria bacterium]|nr:HAD family hydrolase [Deltaproteobacteria bacterium]
MNARKRIGAVIFDCDGVMFESRQANINFYNHLRQHFGLPPLAESEVDYVHMHTAEEAVRYIFRGTPYGDQALAYKGELDYTPFIRDMVPEPGLRPLLETLKPHLKLAVATNRSNTIDRVLKAFGLKDYFDTVISSLDVQRPKPHPESLLKILEIFRLSPDETIYVGDSVIDAQTARSASVPFVAYKNRALDADFHISDLMEIRNIVGI